MTNPYLKQYQKNEVETATPEKILILLYDGAIQFLNKAKVAINDGNIPEIHNNIIGCEKIIAEFMDTLNKDINPELANNLLALYKYFYDTLVEANLHQDISKVEEILGHLMELRETWKKAIAIANAEKRAKLDAEGASDDDDDEDKQSEDWA